jgi:hypothetical protein
MKLARASAWYHNRSNSDIIIDELGLKIKKGEVVDLFKLNPDLSYDRFSESKRSGVLAKKRKELVFLKEPPGPKPEPLVWETILEPGMRVSLSKSCVIVGKDEKDWIDSLETEFGDQAVTQEEAWTIERQKVLKTLETAEIGENGEVFTDTEFASEDDDDGRF